ncbi:SDR family oxidoreductase [Congregibacter brevis]|uniref:SDR family oxidoreductase n=1 Tax=Congregibacter brevis TaxID=3081201 RepID=A0ABZ0IDA7_9GAMM|nr:SDR family oxidoreductase [Congregibacter sp. IMCC45268]
MDVKGKVVVVTGGGNGIGKGLCERFAAEGAAQVVVADLELDSAKAVADAVNGSAYEVNVRDEAQIAAMVVDVIAKFGHIDLFCSNAGIIALDGPPWYATSAPNDTWQAMWDIHVMSHVYAARACLPSMLERGEGYFLNTASAAGLLSQVGDAAYSTTKHAAVGFAESLAITHGDAGVKVSCLCPQAVATRMIGDSEGGTAGVDGILTPADVAEAVVQGLSEERFLILPHPEVAKYRERKTADYDRWIGGMRKLRRQFGNPEV